MNETAHINIKVDTALIRGKKFVSVDSLLLGLFEAKESGHPVDINNFIATLKQLRDEEAKPK